jgi:hypothetical protein
MQIVTIHSPQLSKPKKRAKAERVRPYGVRQ